MPKFVLDHGTPEASKRFAALDAFTQGYIEAAFFTETGYDEDDELHEASLAELAPEAWEAMTKDCADFQARYAADLVAVNAITGYSMTIAGHDFWYTRNGHGVGYWDRDLGDVGDRLSKACGWQTDFPEVYMYRGDDGLIYVS